MTKWYGAMTPDERGQRGLKNETSVPAKTLVDFVTRGIPDMFPLFDDKFKELFPPVNFAIKTEKCSSEKREREFRQTGYPGHCGSLQGRRGDQGQLIICLLVITRLVCPGSTAVWGS